jgi:DNA repair protein RadA/Sms
VAKVKSSFVCQSCGSMHARWEGKCADCGEWNSLVEELQERGGVHERPSIISGAAPTPITDDQANQKERMSSGLSEFDRVLGGGVVEGSLVLVGGDPGIGKSTLMLQLAFRMASEEGPVLYISGEESFHQSQLRANRLGALHDRVMMLTETNIETVRNHLVKNRYACVIIDSIQSMYSPALASVPGSVGQVRECANECLRLAKGQQVPIFLVGHVTKDGNIAGPRVLEHLVDTVLYFEGDGKQTLRILRGVKNRFGSTNEIGVFEMTGKGLLEVPNPSALFLDERPEGISGSAVIPSIEGTRPLLVEVQALVTESHLSLPRRTVTGVNPNRVSLILAVLEKRVGLGFSGMDVFVNVAGGVKLTEPAADLAIALALVSSLRDIPVAPDLTAFGEIGLAGEIRSVDRASIRVSEASKFGFKKCMLPLRGTTTDIPSTVECIAVSSIEDAIEGGMTA